MYILVSLIQCRQYHYLCVTQVGIHLKSAFILSHIDCHNLWFNGFEIWHYLPIKLTSRLSIKIWEIYIYECFYSKYLSYFLIYVFYLYLGDNIIADEMSFNISLSCRFFSGKKLPSFLKGNHTTFAQDLFKLAFTFQNSLKVLTKSNNLYQKGHFHTLFFKCLLFIILFFVLLFGFGV